MDKPHVDAIPSRDLFGTKTIMSKLVPLIQASLRCIPPRLAWRLGGWVGEVVGSLPTRDAKRCRSMLAKGYPEKDAAWVERMARKTFRHVMRMALWTAATMHWDIRRMHRGIVVESPENLRELIRSLKRGEGTVGFTGHVGNWELLSRIGTVFGPLTVVGKRLRSPLADALVQGTRTGTGARLLYQDAPFADFARDVRSGRLLAFLIDQDIERLAGTFVPWFGDLAYTPTGPAAIAQLTRSPVVCVFLYEKAGRWVLHCSPRIRFPRTRDTASDVLAITSWATAYEEAIVRRTPHQWAWWHLRWRTRPEQKQAK